MEKTNFEYLQVYKLSERLADKSGRLWHAGKVLQGIRWESNLFALRTV